MRSSFLSRGPKSLVVAALAASCARSGPGADAAFPASSSALTTGVVQVAPLRKIPTPAPNGGFASALDLAGDVLVVGAPRDDAAGYDAGAVHVRGRDVGGVGSWGLAAKLLASDAAPERAFGTAVALSGALLAVGDPGHDGGGLDAGAVYLFERDAVSGAWTELLRIPAPGGIAGGSFGASVALSGDLLVVGAPGAAAKAGVAHVFSRDAGGAGAWGWVATLTATDGVAGDDFGTAVAVAGTEIVVGAPLADAVGTDSGAAYVFSRDAGGNGAWGLVRKLLGSDTAAGDFFGCSVSMIDGLALVGAYSADFSGFFHAGAGYLFARDAGGAGSWGETNKLVAADAASFRYLGKSVRLQGSTAVLGGSNTSSTGVAYVFGRDAGGAGAWGQTKKLPSSDLGTWDELGAAVALDLDTAVVGATGHKHTGKEWGAAYVYSRNLGGTEAWGEQLEVNTAFATAPVKAGDNFGGKLWTDGSQALTNVSGLNQIRLLGRNQGGPDAWGQVKTLPADQWGEAKMDRDLLVLGNPVNRRAQLYQRDLGGTGSWGLLKTFNEGLTGVQFGTTVDVDGDLVAVGDYGDYTLGTYKGAISLFGRDQGGAGNWGLVKKIVAEDASKGGNLSETCLDVSGDLLIACAYSYGGTGAAYVFGRDQGGTGNWGQVARIVPPAGSVTFGEFGTAGSYDAGTLAVGAPRDFGAGTTTVGSVFVYGRDRGGADAWGLVQRINASPTVMWSYFGKSVSVKGDLMLVGAPDAGLTYLFARDGTGLWSQVTTWAVPGRSVAISGDVALIGDSLDDDFGTDAGAIYVVGIQVDECALGTDDCDVNATCTDTPGSFTCACNPGWYGNGRTCSLTCTPIAAVDVTCDGVDDDCSGQADEDYVSDASCGVGACRTGNTPSTCVGGVETACIAGAPLAATDVTCDGVDDDCSGQADEDYVSDASCGVGACRSGNTPSTCVGGMETGCIAGVPTAEQCSNGVDDDCDGLTDAEDVADCLASPPAESSGCGCGTGDGSSAVALLLFLLAVPGRMRAERGRTHQRP